MRVVTWDRGCMADLKLADMSIFLVVSSDMVHSQVVEVKLVLGPHRSREARHSPEYCTQGTVSDNTVHGGFQMERDICSKLLALIMVVKQGLGQMANPES